MADSPPLPSAVPEGLSITTIVRLVLAFLVLCVLGLIVGEVSDPANLIKTPYKGSQGTVEGEETKGIFNEPVVVCMCACMRDDCLSYLAFS